MEGKPSNFTMSMLILTFDKSAPAREKDDSVLNGILSLLGMRVLVSPERSEAMILMLNSCLSFKGH